MAGSYQPNWPAPPYTDFYGYAWPAPIPYQNAYGQFLPQPPPQSTPDPQASPCDGQAVRTPLAPLPASSQNTPAQHIPVPHKKTTRGAGALTGQDLLLIAQTAVDMDYYQYQRGELGSRDKSFGESLRKRGIAGSDNALKQRLKELLLFHEDPAKAPEALVRLIEGQPVEITLGAPLDRLTAERLKWDGKSDAEKEKLKKKTDEDKRGGEAIRAASLNRSRSTAATTSQGAAAAPPAAAAAAATPGVVPAPAVAIATACDTVAPPASIPATAPPAPGPAANAELAAIGEQRGLSDGPLETPISPTRPAPPPIATMSLPPALRALSPSASIISISDDDDSDIECRGHNLPPAPSSSARVKVKAEEVALAIPKRKSVENPSTPLPSIPRPTSTTTATGKRTTNSPAVDSDAEDTPVRKTKRIRRTESFDLAGFMKEERTKREEFQGQMLNQLREGNAEFRKAAADTRAFQNDFLGLLRGVFNPN